MCSKGVSVCMISTVRAGLVSVLVFSISISISISVSVLVKDDGEW